MAQPNRQQRRQSRASQAGPPDRIEAVYAKSNACRVIHADGAYGGVTPQLNVYMALYSEHNAMPDVSVYVLDHVEKTAREQQRPEPNKWVREIETEVIMSLDMARALRDWLDGRLAIADKMQSDPKAVYSTRNTDTGGSHANPSA